MTDFTVIVMAAPPMLCRQGTPRGAAIDLGDSSSDEDEMFDAAAVAAMIAPPAGAAPVDGQPNPSGATAPMASGGGTAEVDEPRPPSYTPPRLVAAVLPWPRCSPLPRVLPRLTGSPSRVTPPRRRLPAASGGGTAEVGEPRLPSYTPPRMEESVEAEVLLHDTPGSRHMAENDTQKPLRQPEGP